VKGTSTKQQENVVCLILTFKDQKSADIVRIKTTHGSWIVDRETLPPVFTSRKVRDDVKVQEVTDLEIILAFLGS
jgi:hypothetical protein